MYVCVRVYVHMCGLSPPSDWSMEYTCTSISSLISGPSSVHTPQTCPVHRLLCTAEWVGKCCPLPLPLLLPDKGRLDPHLPDLLPFPVNSRVAVFDLFRENGLCDVSLLLYSVSTGPFYVYILLSTY